MNCKKITATLLSVAMLTGISTMPDIPVKMISDFSTIAADIVDSGTCGDNLTWTLDDEGTLTISGTGEMENYDYNFDKSPFYMSETIKNVVISKGVTTIGNSAFSFCSSLETVKLPDTLKVIGENAFMMCRKLQAVDIPDSVEKIGSCAFVECNSLTSVVIPDSVTELEDCTFSFCTSLKTVKIGSGVKELQGQKHSGAPFGVFGSCKNLESVEMTDSVEKIGTYAFAGCPKLADIKLSKNIIYIGSGALDGTQWYENQPDGFVYAGKTVLGYKGDLPENTTLEIEEGTVSIAESAFSNKENIVSVKLPDSLKSIGSYAFSWTKIEDIYIPDSVTDVGEAVFYGCDKLKTCRLPDGLTKLPTDTFCGNFSGFFGSCSSLQTIELPKSLTSIDCFLFDNCTSLEKIVIPDQVTEIGFSAFGGCTNLSDILLPKSVENIGSGAFYDTPWFKTQSENNDFVITNGILIASSKKGDVIIPNTVKKISDYSFDRNNYITSVAIPDSVTEIGSNAFSNCENLTGIIIPDSVEKIGRNAFDGCSSLKSVTLPDSVKDFPAAFYSCSGLETVFLPDDLKTISESAFNRCENLKSVEIPDKVKKIDDSAFNGCKKLEVLSIPASVKSIGRFALSYCERLQTVTILAPDCEIYDENVTLCNGSRDEYNEEKGYSESIYYFDGIIRGYKGSTAEKYAEKYGYKFESLGEAPAKTYAFGDPTGDDLIDASDASFVLAEYAKISTGGTSELTDAEKTAADVNGDGAVDASDASAILAYYAHVSTGGQLTFEDFMKENA